MTSCTEALGGGFWNLKKKTELRFGLGRSKLIFGGRRGQTSRLRRGAARSGVRWKNQHRKKLCLSLLMSKNLKRKKVIKSFVPELKESHQSVSCISRFPMNILHIHIFVVSLDVDILHKQRFIFCWFGRSLSGVNPVLNSYTRPCGHFTGCTNPKTKTKQQTEGGRKKKTDKHGFKTAVHRKVKYCTFEHFECICYG